MTLAVKRDATFRQVGNTKKGIIAKVIEHGKTKHRDKLNHIKKLT